MKKRWTLLAKITLAGMLATSVASGYYHFIHFNSRFSPFTPIPEKFDLSALVDKTVRFYIDADGPVEMASGDSFESIVSQVRLAGDVWSQVETSELNVCFGGLGSAQTPQSTPGIDLIFDEIPPGLIAVGGPTSRGPLASDENGPFIPIQRSVMILNKDLSSQPSYGEAFFLTLVHEMGHALGLQHTLTSSVMATSLTRGTTKAAPLDVDDIAGISLLYPTPDFKRQTGTIAGRVTVDGDAVNLASVVALSPQGPSVSTLTNPDGSYRIEGIPPGQYLVYVHPLPLPVFGEVSPANIVLPRDAEDEPIAVGRLFQTRFYPGVQTADAAVSMAVQAGGTIEGVDFAVGSRDGLDVYAVSTYSFPGNLAVRPGHLSFSTNRPFLVASGVGLAVDGAPARGLGASVIGGSAAISGDGLIPYAPDPRFVQINLSLRPFSGSGARHLLFSLNNDLYVLPAGLHLTQSEPPLIDALASGFDPSGHPAVAVAGRNIGPETRILFDGEPAPITRVGRPGLVFVSPPPAASEHEAVVVALNPDGQSSLFLQGGDSPRWRFEGSSEAAIDVTPKELRAGSEAMIEVRGTNTNFREGLTELGFGSSDVVVRDLWVLDESNLIANVAVPTNANLANVPVAVVTGLELLTEPSFEIMSQATEAAAVPVVHTPAFHPYLNDVGVTVGGLGAVRVSGLSDAAGFSMTLNDERVTVVSLEDSVVTFEVPASARPGPAVLRLNSSVGNALPVVIRIDAAPPSIAAIFGADNAQINGGRAARPGEMLAIVALGFDDDESISPSRLKVEVGGIAHSVHQVVPVNGLPGGRLVHFFLGTNVPENPNVPVRLALDGRFSAQVFIGVGPAR